MSGTDVVICIIGIVGALFLARAILALGQIVEWVVRQYKRF
jgi:hypothetical protein